MSQHNIKYPNMTSHTLASDILRWCVWAAVMPPVVIAPWFFGAWEMWWFWPFASLIAVSVIFLGLRLVMTGAGAPTGIKGSGRLGILVIPFLCYAVVRGWMSPVFMDAQRTVLLHISGVSVAAVVVFGLVPRQRRLLFMLLFFSLAAMAVYGVVNQVVFNSRHVLWMPRYEQYAGRATGPYFCPDHFAGAMELLFCMSTGLLLDRRGRRGRTRWMAAGAAVLAVAGIVFSKSRGAGGVLVVVGACVLVWAFVQWPRRVRWYWRLMTVSVALLAGIAVLQFFPSYMDRVVTYGGLHMARETETSSVQQEVFRRLRQTSRGRMYGGAWRAWQTAPWTGIGPGMHQHVWPRFAASPDGNRERCVWPSLTNTDFHSYEVHSDGLQLLEEYGILGGILFLCPLLAVAFHLRQNLKRESLCWREVGVTPPGEDGFTFTLSGLLALVAMTFHSLGDFNLQMPGTVWMLAALLGIAIVAGNKPGIDVEGDMS